MQKIVSFRSQFNSWFLNFDVIKVYHFSELENLTFISGSLEEV